MKRYVILMALCLTLISGLSAADPGFGKLTEPQKYDLAHAYNMVADRFDELKNPKRAESYRRMVEMIYPGFRNTPPRTTAQQSVTVRPARKPAVNPAGKDAAIYYFGKILRGLGTENAALALSCVSDPLYLPQYDKGISKEFAESELEWAFDKYDMQSLSANDVFDMNSISVTPLNNGYWRLDVRTRPGYEKALPFTFWSGKMGFYFRNFSEGWRLAAIGPVK